MNSYRSIDKEFECAFNNRIGSLIKDGARINGTDDELVMDLRIVEECIVGDVEISYELGFILYEHHDEIVRELEKRQKVRKISTSYRSRMTNILPELVW